VTDNLFSSGAITANEIGISFEPTDSIESENGQLTWGQSSFPDMTISMLIVLISGGTDSSKFTGTINMAYDPIYLTQWLGAHIRYQSSHLYFAGQGLLGYQSVHSLWHLYHHLVNYRWYC